MALETYTASGRIRGGPVSAPEDISTATLPARALGGLGNSISELGGDVARIAEQRNKEQELRWASDHSNALKDELIKWEQENQGREDIGAAYREYADKALQERVKEAPNARAAEVLKREMAPSIRADWEKNLKIGEHIRLDNFKVGELKSSETSNDGFRQRMILDPEGAQYVRSQDLASQTARIETAYGKIAPAMAASLKEKAIADAVLGASERDPSFARELLNAHPGVDSQTREQLLAHINAAENSLNGLAKLQQANAFEATLAAAETTQSPVKRPDASAFRIFGEQKAEVMFKFNERADALDKAASFYGGIKDKNSSYQIGKLDEAEKKAAASQDLSEIRGVQQAKQWARQSMELQHDDSVSWQKRYQDPVRKAYTEAAQYSKQAAEMPKDSYSQEVALSTANQMWQKAYGLSVTLQGHPPTGTPEAEAAMFLNKDQTNLLSKQDATEWAAKITEAGPEQRVAMIDSLKAQYGDYAEKFFSDLSTLPDKSHQLDPAIAQAIGIRNRQVKAGYFEAQKNSDALTKLDDKKVAEYLNALGSNPDWNSYVKGWQGAYTQRAGPVQQARQGILNYAESLFVGSKGSQKELTVVDAINQAVKGVITADQGMANINGRVVPINRERGVGKPDRTDEDISNAGRGMEILLRQLDPNDIKRTGSEGQAIFPIAPVGQPENDFVMRRIWQHGFFVTDQKGNSATLYIPTDDGNTIQLRDNNNMALRVVFDDIPQYLQTKTRLTEHLGKVTETKYQEGKTPAEFEKGMGHVNNTFGDSIVRAFMLSAPGFHGGKPDDKFNWPVTSPVYQRNAP